MKTTDFNSFEYYEYPGLPRECPHCLVVSHHKIKGRKIVEKDVECPSCHKEFTITKYKKGDVPK